MMTRFEAATAISKAWNEWLETDDHNFNCIAYSEGQGCCADPELHVAGYSDGPYAGRQSKLIMLALDALGIA